MNVETKLTGGGGATRTKTIVAFRADPTRIFCDLWEISETIVGDLELCKIRKTFKDVWKFIEKIAREIDVFEVFKGSNGIGKIDEIVLREIEFLETSEKTDFIGDRGNGICGKKEDVQFLHQGDGRRNLCE